MDQPNAHRLLLSPSYDRQQDEIALALERVWRQGGWTVYIDELFYLTDMLGLSAFVTRLLTQGRSKGISVVVGMQRPVLVTRFAISEATHIISFNLDGRDVKTMSEAASTKFAKVGATLRKHEFAWMYRPNVAEPDERKWLFRGFAQDLGVDVRAA